MANPTDNSGDKRLYLSIDHLKKGTYILSILLNNHVVKTIEIKKET